MRRTSFGLTLVMVALALGCGASPTQTEGQDTYQPPEDIFTLGDTGPGLNGKGIGQECVIDSKGDTDCRSGLKCIQGYCIATGDTPENEYCVITDECQAGLHCSIVGKCHPAGDGAVGDLCMHAGHCQAGLYCHSMGIGGYCAEAGDRDIGGQCDSPADCLAGLTCTLNGTCEAGNLAYGIQPWPGVNSTVCIPGVDPGDPRVYFEIPRDDVTEFFRLPYPNDIRIRSGRVKLDGFPTPGPGMVGFDPVDRFVDAIETTDAGFSTVPTAYFRFSTGFDHGTITTGGESPRLRFIDLETGAGRKYSWFYNGGSSKYICPRWLAVKTAWDAPLEPGKTYAVILSEGLQSTGGDLLEADSDMLLMLSASEPSNATERAAWQAYQPLRDWLQTNAIPTSSIVAAAVFTTQQTTATLPKVREAVHALDQPVPTELTLCGGGAISPCDDGLTGEAHTRGCFGESDEVHELHMKVPLPIVQVGTRPYLDPTMGGGLAVDADGDPAFSETEEVCVSLTIPKKVSTPAAGWPLLIYGHGAGKSFLSAVNNAGLPLSSVDVDGTVVGAAVLGWDGPMHGPRRGSEISPEALFYNFANPPAARGNLIQGAADVFALVRAFKDLVIPPEDSPTGQEIRFDPNFLGYIGHSQGATTGPLASPYEPDIKLNVWSGASAGLGLSLLQETMPVTTQEGVSMAFQEFTVEGLTSVGDNHPVVRLIQQYFDPVDPINHAAMQIKKSLPEVGPQHVLHVFGLGDSYAPPDTSKVFARLLGVHHVLAAPGADPLYDLDLTLADPPLSANFHGSTITGGVVVHMPNGYDGHYVMFQNASAKKQYEQFIGSWIASGGVPTVVGAE